MLWMFVLVGLSSWRASKLHDEVNEIVFLGAAVQWHLVTRQEPTQFTHGEVTSQVVVCVVTHHQRQAFSTRRLSTETAATSHETLTTVQLRATGTFLRSTTDITYITETSPISDSESKELLVARVQTHGYVPQKTRWVFFGYTHLKKPTPKKPTLLR